MLFVLLTLLLLSKKSDPIYLSMCFFLLSAFTAVQVEGLFRSISVRADVALGASYCFLLVLAIRSAGDVELHAMLLAGNHCAIVMAIAQIVLLAAYVLLAARIFGELHVSHSFAQPKGRLEGMIVT